MLEQQNIKLSLQRKIILSLGLLVAIMIIIFAQFIRIKAKPDNNVEIKMIQDDIEKSDLHELKNLQKINSDSSSYNGRSKTEGKGSNPKTGSNTNNRLFESI